MTTPTNDQSVLTPSSARRGERVLVGVPVIDVRDPLDARERLGIGLCQKVGADAANDGEGDEGDQPRRYVDRCRAPPRAHPSDLRLQLVPQSRGIGMPRMGVGQMPKEVLRLHGNVADRAVIRLRQRGTFRFSETKEKVHLFRNDAYEARTHAYIAPDASVERIGLAPSTLSTARSKSAIVTTSRSSRIANMPASVHIAWISAPVVPSHRPARTP